MGEGMAPNAAGDREDRGGARGVVIGAVVDLPAPDSQMIVMRREYDVVPWRFRAWNHSQHIDSGSVALGHRKGVLEAFAERGDAERFEPLHQVMAGAGAAR